VEVFRIEHTDFILTVDCLGFEKAFTKAKTRQKDFLKSTVYSYSKGIAYIISPDTLKLREIYNENIYPVFFENKDYFFDIEFKDIDDDYKPKIITKLKEIEEKFKYRKNHRLLAGTVNFGNNIGKSNIQFNYRKNDKIIKFNFGFDVFPTKLDYRNDYLKMVKDIEESYPNLILDFLKKTHTNYATKQGSNNDLIWWQIFGGLYEDFLKASQFILNKPHAQLITKIKYLKADRIKKLTPIQEELIILNRKTPNKLYRTEIRKQSVNTIENRFFKFALQKTTRRYKNLKKYILNKYSDKLTFDFKIKLNDIENKLGVFISNPFLKNVGTFNGFKQESLLIQRGTGYSSIYKNWILLNSGLKFLDGIQKLEQKNIADLYEIWCFLEVKNIIQRIVGKKPSQIDLAQIEIDDFVFKFNKGVKSRILYKKDNGDEIELFHDYQFNKSVEDRLKSYTVNQRPDIVVKLTKNDLKEKYKFTYLYDAKYRLVSDDNDTGADIPPDDAINQMHRYRDSIYYKDPDKSKPEKEIIGGYILFPGVGDIEKIKSHSFFKSIEKVNIGAFPLKPNDVYNKSLLVDHFTEILGLNSESILNEIIPQKDLDYDTSNPDVLIGIVTKKEHIKYIESGSELYYHTGSKKPNRFGYKDLKYFSPYIKGKGCKYYYDIINYSIKPRNKIYNSKSEIDSEDPSERLVLHLGNRYTIKNEEYFKLLPSTFRSPYRYTKLSYIKNLESNRIIAPIKEKMPAENIG